MPVDQDKLAMALVSLPNPAPRLVLPKDHPYWGLNAEEKAAWRAKIGRPEDAAQVVKAR